MNWKEIAQSKEIAHLVSTIKSYYLNPLPNNQKKQHQRDSQIPTEWTVKTSEDQLRVISVVGDSSILSATEKQLILLDATDLASKIAAKIYTAVEVIMAYFKAASIAQQHVNCLTEIFFDKALVRAQELDDYLKVNGTTVGPLHGVPISLKDQINIAGIDSTAGFIGYAGNAPKESATLVDICLKAGAVFYCKTQNPQSLMILDGNNNVFGTPLNPWNKKLTPGGSTSGEGALIAMHGSVLGVGGDIGGSIRCPAAFNGIYGFKPSSERVPGTGCISSYYGQENVKGCMGPLSRSVRDVDLWMKIILDDKPWMYDNPNLLPMPWVEIKAPKRLNIGIMAFDGVVHVHPPISRAMEFAKKALVDAGHEVVEFPAIHAQKAWDIIFSLYFPDGGDCYFRDLALSGEPMCDAPRRFIASNKVKQVTIPEHFRNVVRKQEFQVQFLKHWNSLQGDISKPIDVILCPASAALAYPHGFIPWWGYTSYWNLLDLPSFVFPSGLHADANIDKPYSSFESAGELDDINNKLYDVDTYNGMPIGLQVVGRRLHDEFTVATTSVIEKALNQYIA